MSSQKKKIKLIHKKCTRGAIKAHLYNLISLDALPTSQSDPLKQRWVFESQLQSQVRMVCLVLELHTTLVRDFQRVCPPQCAAMQGCNAPLTRAVGFPTRALCVQVNPCAWHSLPSGVKGKFTWELSNKMSTLAFFSDTFPFKIYILLL